MSRQEDEDRAQLLEERKQGLGSSDIAAVMGHDPYRTPYDVWREKRGLAEPIPDNPAMRRGREMEPLAAQMYEEEAERRVRRVGLKVHPDHPFAIAHIDRQILLDPRGPGALELKAPGRDVFRIWQAKGIPDRVILQHQWQMFVAGWYWGSIYPFSADLWEGFTFDSHRQDNLTDAMLEAADRFWHQNVLADVPPEIDRVIEIPDLPKDARLRVVRSKAWTETIDRLLEVRELMTNLEETKEHWTEVAKDLMMAEDTSAVELEGRARIYWTERPGSRRLDKEALQHARLLDRNKVLGILTRYVKDNEGVLALSDELDGCEADLDDYKKRTKGSRPFRLFPLSRQEV